MAANGAPFYVPAVAASGTLASTYKLNGWIPSSAGAPTATRRTFYTDAELTTPASNPATLGASGRVVYVNPALPIVFTLTSADGGTTYDTIYVPAELDASGAAALTPLVVANNATLTALTSGTGLVDNGVYQTLGRSTERDGGEGLWVYDSASTTTANTGTVLAIDGGGAGRFFRIRESDRVVWVQWFGDLTTASGFTAAWQAATTAAGVGGVVNIPYGTYSINGAITPLGAQHHIGHGKPFITKTANVTNLFVMTTATRARLQGFVIDGDGGTYTGKGVYIGADAASYEQEIIDCQFDDFSSAVVHFDGADAGSRCVFKNSYFRRTTVTDPAIVGTTTVDVNGGNRQFIECASLGGILIQMNKMTNSSVINCQAKNLDLSGSDTISLRMRCVGNRFATEGDAFTIYGNDSSYVGNVIAGAGVISGAASRNEIGLNTLLASTVWTDNSTATGDNVNRIDAAEYTVTATLTGSGSNPTTSAKTCRVTRAGRRVAIDFSATLNAVGSGTYQIALPSPFTTWVAKHAARGVGLFTDASTGNTYNLVAVVATGGATITLYTGNALVTDAAPVAAAAGDIITFSIEYEIA